MSLTNELACSTVSPKQVADEESTSVQKGVLLELRDGAGFLTAERVTVGSLTSFERSFDLNLDRTRVREATRDVIGWSRARL